MMLNVGVKKCSRFSNTANFPMSHTVLQGVWITELLYNEIFGKQLRGQ